MGRSVLRPYICLCLGLKRRIGITKRKVKGPIQIFWTGPFLLPLSNFEMRRWLRRGLNYASAWRLAIAIGPTRGAALWKPGG